MGEQSDEELMLRYVDNGDKAAFQLIFERFSPRLFGMGMRHMRREDLAQDLVQRTFLRFHRARYDFRRDAKVSPWITTIAMNLIREHWRRGKKRQHFEFDPALHGQDAVVDTDIEQKERAKELHLALSSLSEMQRAVIELYWFQEMSFRQVAETLGSTEGAVRVRAHRAIQKLRVVLEGKIEK